MNEYQEAISLIEQIQRIGFPNADNIDEIENLIVQLEKVPFKEAVHRTSIKHLHKVVKSIKDKIEKGEDIPVRKYTKLNARLVVFKNNLLHSH